MGSEDELDWARAVVESAAPRQRELLAVIWNSHDSALVERAVNHPSITDRTLRGAAIGVRLEPHGSVIASCSRESVLRRWATSPDPAIRTLVAFNPSTPDDVALDLLSDPEAGVRANAAYHPSIPVASLGRVASTDPSTRVREAAQDALGTEFGQALRAGQRLAWVTEPSDDVAARSD